METITMTVPELENMIEKTIVRALEKFKTSEHRGKFYNINQVAKILGKAHTTVVKNVLPYLRQDAGGDIIGDSLADYIENNEVQLP